jgi:hypothetical protein
MFGLFKEKLAPQAPRPSNTEHSKLNEQRERPVISAKPRILPSLLIAKESQSRRFNDPTSHF